MTNQTLTLDQQNRECERLYELARTLKWQLLVECNEVKPLVSASQWYIWKNSNNRHPKLKDYDAKSIVAKLIEREDVDEYTKHFISEMTKDNLYNL